MSEKAANAQTKTWKKILKEKHDNTMGGSRLLHNAVHLNNGACKLNFSVRRGNKFTFLHLMVFYRSYNYIASCGLLAKKQ